MPDEPQYPGAFNVPLPPDGTLFDDQLKWCVFVMNRGDPQRHFAASCLASLLKYGGLTDRQAAACSEIIARIAEHYGAGALDCQTEVDEPDWTPPPNRRDVH